MRRTAAEMLDATTLAALAGSLREGGVIAYPTDTAYGLGVDPSNRAAVERLFELKGRAADKPILLLVDSMAMARSLARPNPAFERVAAAFWPGPITLVTWAGADLSAGITAGTGTVGLRWPDAPLPLEIVRTFGGPLTATSANRSGSPIARTASEILEQLGGGLDWIIDGGPLRNRRPSTVLDLTREPAALLREGPMSYEALADHLDGRLRRLSS